MGWCFGKVNNRLAEVYFDDDKPLKSRVFGHFYVKQENYKTKKQIKLTDEMTKNLKK